LEWSHLSLKHFIKGRKDGKIEVTERRGGRCKQLLDDKEIIGYCKLKDEALNRSMRRNCLGSDCGRDVRQNTE
jgi:hypothetical protein